MLCRQVLRREEASEAPHTTELLEAPELLDGKAVPGSELELHPCPIALRTEAADEQPMEATDGPLGQWRQRWTRS